MNQEKLDRWGNTAGSDQLQNEYNAEMAAIQKGYQDRSLERLRVRLAAAGIDWDYQGGMRNVC